MAAVGGEGTEGAAGSRGLVVGRQLERVDVDDALNLLDEIPLRIPPTMLLHQPRT